MNRRRVVTACLVCVTVAATVGVPARAQTATQCFDPNAPTPEIYGPTDISATSGNQRLSVALNDDATVTVLRWPSPSFYDQIKYRTLDRSEPRFGALPNEGAMLGIAWEPGDPPGRSGFAWLREWRSRQRFADDDGDEVVTRFRKRKLGLAVVVRDLVAPGVDALVRRVTVRRTPSSAVRRIRLFSFANFNPVFSKSPQAPVQDWCFEDSNDDGARYDLDRDAVVHARSGIDEATGAASSVALVMGFDRPSTEHEIGSDTYEVGGSGQSAYDDAFDSRLSGNDMVSGQADAVLARALQLQTRRRASATAIIAAGPSEQDALAALQAARSATYRSIRDHKQRWWKTWLRDAPLPRSAPANVVRLSKRALVSLRQAIDRSTREIAPENQLLAPGGLIVASIATQSPYGQDWIRHGAYINRALDVAGHPETVAQHNYRYAVLQHAAGDTLRGGQAIPPGNWAMNHYADGIVGGPIPYEIDETGYGIWTLWDHYAQTKDRNYLLFDHGGVVYLAIQRAAQYLTDVCKDVSTGLQCVANEDDNPDLRQTLYGASLVWLGLDSAAKAARVKGSDEALANAKKWEARRDELRAAIQRHFFDPECKCYTRDFAVGGTLLWPVEYVSKESGRAASQARMNWRDVRKSFSGKRVRGRYEAKALLGNAHVWGGHQRKLERLRKGLRWLAGVATTDETGILGEAWMRYPAPDGPVTTMVSQPHVWQQVLFYLAALKAYGRAPYRF